MTVLVHSPTRKSSEVPVEWVGLDDLWRRADVITLHCPLTDATRHLIRAETIARMKPDVRLINTGRGDLVDEVELERALRSGRVAGFGGDVLSTEPPAAGHPLFTAPNAIITPHVAWASVEARRRLMDILVENVRAFLAGHPVNVVN